jgi:hypothetical protein
LECADTASSAGSGGNREAKGDNLTLAELSKHLSIVKASLRNVRFQFVEAEKTVNVSDMLLAFSFFCRLQRCAG